MLCKSSVVTILFLVCLQRLLSTRPNWLTMCVAVHCQRPAAVLPTKVSGEGTLEVDRHLSVCRLTVGCSIVWLVGFSLVCTCLHFDQFGFVWTTTHDLADCFLVVFLFSVLLLCETDIQYLLISMHKQFWCWLKSELIKISNMFLSSLYLCHIDQCSEALLPPWACNCHCDIIPTVLVACVDINTCR